MEFIPLINFRKRKIYTRGKYYNTSSAEIVEDIYRYKKIYFLDWDGIYKNKPNFCTYQRLSSSIELWVDAAPRNMGDVVDLVMAGSQKIILRDKLWPHINLQDIRKVTDCELLSKLYFDYQEGDKTPVHLIDESDGLIILDNKKETQKQSNYERFIEKVTLKHDTYGYENNIRAIAFWKKIGVKGLLVEYDKIEEFKKNAH